MDRTPSQHRALPGPFISSTFTDHRDDYEGFKSGICITEMQKAADAADISVLFFSAGANFWAILGHFWAIFGATFFGQQFISAIFITFCISGSGAS